MVRIRRHGRKRGDLLPPDRIHLNLTILPFFRLQVEKPFPAMGPSVDVTIKGIEWSGEEVRARLSTFRPHGWQPSVVEPVNPYVGTVPRMVHLFLDPTPNRTTVDDILCVVRSLIAHLLRA